MLLRAGAAHTRTWGNVNEWRLVDEDKLEVGNIPDIVLYKEVGDVPRGGVSCSESCLWPPLTPMDCVLSTLGLESVSGVEARVEARGQMGGESRSPSHGLTQHIYAARAS